MLRIAIYECSKELANQVRSLLNVLYYGEANIVTCESLFALESYIFDERNGNLDILFVGLSDPAGGILAEVAKIQQEYPHIQAAFIADKAEQALPIFQANPAFFLLRPVQEEQLQAAMNRMVVRLRREQCKMVILESAKDVLIIPRDDILYIESNRREVTFVLTQNRREKGQGRLDDLGMRLGKRFIRCHQSYLVNADKIRRILSKELILYNGWKVPISRARHKEMKEELLRYFGWDREVETVEEGDEG